MRTWPPQTAWWKNKRASRYLTLAPGPQNRQKKPLWKWNSKTWRLGLLKIFWWFHMLCRNILNDFPHYKCLKLCCPTSLRKSRPCLRHAFPFLRIASRFGWRPFLEWSSSQNPCCTSAARFWAPFSVCWRNISLFFCCNFFSGRSLPQALFSTFWGCSRILYSYRTRIQKEKPELNQKENGPSSRFWRSASAQWCKSFRSFSLWLRGRNSKSCQSKRRATKSPSEQRSTFQSPRSCGSFQTDSL